MDELFNNNINNNNDGNSLFSPLSFEKTNQIEGKFFQFGSTWSKIKCEDVIAMCQKLDVMR